MLLGVHFILQTSNLKFARKNYTNLNINKAKYKSAIEIHFEILNKKDQMLLILNVWTYGGVYCSPTSEVQSKKPAHHQ